MPDLLALADLGRAAVETVAFPVALWTVVALIAEGALRATNATAALALPVRGSLLAALPVAVLAPTALAALAPGAAVAVAALAPDVAWLPGVAVGGPAPDVAAAGLDRLDALVGAAVALAAMLATVRLAQLGTAAVRSARLRSTLAPADADGRAAVEAARRSLGVAQAVSAARAPVGAAPFTLGWRRPVVALPPDLKPTAREVAAVHEVAHVQRADYAWHAAQRAVAAVFAAHPLVAVLARGLDLDRERAADAAVLAACPGRRRAYADLLFSYAALPAPPLALGAVGGSSTLKSRIDAMTTPLSPARLRRLARTGRLVGLVALSLVAGLAASSAAPPPSDPAVDPIRALQDAPRDTTEVYEVVDEMPQLVGGLEGLMERVEYPELARRSGIQGRVLIQFVVDPEGRVTGPEAIRSPHEMLARAAIEAVTASRFTPGRQDGQAVPVRFVVPVVFALSDDETAEAGPAPGETDADQPEVLMVVDEMPEIIGGLTALQERVVYPPIAKDAGVEGTVVVQFLVNETGGVEEAQVTRSPSEVLSAAALEAVRELRFTPGRQDGEAVKVRFAVPVTFRLPADDDTGVRMDRAAPEGTVRYAGVDVDRLAPGSRQAFLNTLDGAADILAQNGTAAGDLEVRYTIGADGRPSPAEYVNGNRDMMSLATFLVGTMRLAENARPGPGGTYDGMLRLWYTPQG